MHCQQRTPPFSAYLHSTGDRAPITNPRITIQANNLYISAADGWYGGKKKNANAPNRPGLYDLSKHPGETTNLSSEKPVILKELQARLEQAKARARSRP